MTAAHPSRRDKRASRKAKREKRRRPWPLIATALLMAGQFVGSLLMNFINFIFISDGNPSFASFDQEINYLINNILLIGGLLLITGFSLFTLFALLRRWRNAWTVVMTSQIAVLGVGLLVYLSDDLESYVLNFGYAMLAYGVYVVGYLLIPGVQAAFIPEGGTHHVH